MPGSGPADPPVPASGPEKICFPFYRAHYRITI
jgi:hypothetical protein